MHRFKLHIHNVELGIRENKDIAVHCFFSFAVSLNFQLDAVCAVDEMDAASMHFLTGHGAQIDQKPELIVGVELFQSYTGVCIFLS